MPDVKEALSESVKRLVALQEAAKRVAEEVRQAKEREALTGSAQSSQKQ